jgi:serine/threonine-protein kinase
VEARQVLGARYRLEDELGEGGMAVVWRAFDLVLGRSVAVKVLSARLAADDQFRESIRAEAQAAARVSHPHLANVYDYGESLDHDGNPVPYVVMELLTGRTLNDRLATGPLPPRAGLRVCAEIASALAAAHQANLVHRDVKPGNIILTPTGAKLVDFGVAAAAGAPDSTGPDGTIMGTPNYVAPERLTGGPVVAASDVYALGVLIFRVLTARLPWPSGKPTPSERADPEPLPNIHGLPPAIGELYLRCLAVNPDDRPSAHEAASILAAAAGVQPVFSHSDGDHDDDDDDDGEEFFDRPGIRGQIPGGPVPVLVASVGAHPAEVPVPTYRRTRVAAMVAAVLATAVATVLVFAFDGQTTQPPAFADRADPTGTGSPKDTAVGTPQPTSAPTTLHGDSGGQPIATVVGTHTVLITPPTGPTMTAGPPVTTTHPVPTPPPPSLPVSQTFVDADGNTVVAACVDGSQASLSSWSPAPGYKVQPEMQPGPAASAWITFKMKSERIKFTVTCDGRQPEAAITEA